MGGVVTKSDAPEQDWLPETKLEAKVVEAMQKRASKGTSMRSFDSIVLKFPKIDESFRNCKATFQEFDEDSNGAIDKEEMKRCFHKLVISFAEEEINDLFEACDINEDMEIEFNEFIVLLCLVYLLKDDQAALHTVSNKIVMWQILTRKIVVPDFIFQTCYATSVVSPSKFRWIEKLQSGMPNLEPTFEILVDTFVFLDKNKDGYVSKNEMIQAIHETTAGERSSGRIAMRRFEEMDWDKNGMVNFKEFLFAFTRWVGIDENEDDEEEDKD